MRLFGWFRRAPQQGGDSDGSAAQRWGWLGGRRVLRNSPYILPKDEVEGSRLDLQHYAYKLGLGGNYRAPIRQPRTILDVACGTGIWGREMALEFKRAEVVGFDIDRTPMEASLARLGPTGQFPPNFTFLEADALKPFPFEDQRFDFTHARLISPFVPVARWPDVVSEMVRVTRIGGYVELVDFEPGITECQAFTALNDAMKQLMIARGLHTGAAPFLADYLRRAGLSRVQERRFLLGTGRDSQRQQRLLIADGLAVLTNLQAIVVKAGILSEAEYSSLLARAREELPRVGIILPVVCAFSIKL
jgi:ubiquinone/menaquinone biosynthesis C-methylase UbiE